MIKFLPLLVITILVAGLVGAKVDSVNGGSESNVLGICTGGNCGANNSVPAGAVMYFNLSSCPGGWSEVTNARGRYIVGIPSGGTLAGTDGTALSDKEDRPSGRTSASFTTAAQNGVAVNIHDPGHSHGTSISVNIGVQDGRGGVNGSSGTSYISYPSSVAYTGITADVNIPALSGTATIGSVDGTNAPYIQFLVCQKN